MKNILIVDFGFSNPEQIAKIVENFANVHITTFDKAYEKAVELNVDGIIFGGGIADIKAEDAPRVNLEIYALHKPILGICSGMELIALDFGAEVGKGKYAFEKGDVIATVEPNSVLFENLPAKQHTHMYHGYCVESLPDGFVVTASTDGGPYAAFENTTQKIYATIFHTEGKYSEYGSEIFKNFINSI